MADDNWWPMQILIKCPNQIVRQVSALSHRALQVLKESYISSIQWILAYKIL